MTLIADSAPAARGTGGTRPRSLRLTNKNPTLTDDNPPDVPGDRRKPPSIGGDNRYTDCPHVPGLERLLHANTLECPNEGTSPTTRFAALADREGTLEHMARKGLSPSSPCPHEKA